MPYFQEEICFIRRFSMAKIYTKEEAITDGFEIALIDNIGSYVDIHGKTYKQYIYGYHEEDEWVSAGFCYEEISRD